MGSLWNLVSDRTEDQLDHPRRVALSEQVGYSKLHSLANWLVLLFLALVAIMALTCDLYLGAIVMWISFQLMLWSYSLGPRLKPRRFGATLLLGGVSGYFFLVGWIGGGLSDMTPALSTGILLWAMGSSLTGSKDAPDIEGDQVAGYRSVYHDLIEANRPFLRATAIFSRPYVVAAVLSILTLSEGPGWRLLWCWAVFPLAIVVAWALTHAKTSGERGFLRDVGYLYWMVFMGAVLVSLFPGTLSLGVAIASLGWYLLASRLLHPEPTPRISHLLRYLSPGIP
jgi:4-hydroxybenzoate polyprenyltransferase